MSLESVVEERTDKGMDQKEKSSVKVKYLVKLNCEWRTLPKRSNCETFGTISTALGPVITKTADRKIIMNHHTRGQTRKSVLIDCHEKFEQAQNK